MHYKHTYPIHYTYIYYIIHHTINILITCTILITLLTCTLLPFLVPRSKMCSPARLPPTKEMALMEGASHRKFTVSTPPWIIYIDSVYT